MLPVRQREASHSLGVGVESIQCLTTEQRRIVLEACCLYDVVLFHIQ